MTEEDVQSAQETKAAQGKEEKEEAVEKQQHEPLPVLRAHPGWRRQEEGTTNMRTGWVPGRSHSPWHHHTRHLHGGNNHMFIFQFNLTHNCVTKYITRTIQDCVQIIKEGFMERSGAAIEFGVLAFAKTQKEEAATKK